MTSKVTFTFFASIITSVISIKLGTYNTFQILTNPLASTLKPAQIQQIADSDIDVLCLQELIGMPLLLDYINLLAQEGFTHSFSTFNIQQESSPSNLVTPRIPCNQQEIDAINSTCSQNCAPLYPQVVDYASCLAALCPDDYDQIIYTECAGCLGSYPAIQPILAALPGFTLDIDAASKFCLDPPDLRAFPGGFNFAANLFNLTEGIAIVSKTNYPILNTWSFILPSFILLEKRLQIAEIDICADTDPWNDDCSDTIIVGCTHLEPTGFVDDTNIAQSPRLNEPDITSHIGLNRLQTQFMVDNVFNNHILTTLGRDCDSDNILGIFLMGDMNNGKLFSQCDFVNDDGNITADNCELPDNAPLNPYDIFGNNGLVDAVDIKYRASVNEGVKCTFCIDPANEDFNILAVDESNTFINDPATSRDLDHIFVQNGYRKNFKKLSFAREFKEKVVELGDETELVPASDHYAVTLDIEFC